MNNLPIIYCLLVLVTRLIVVSVSDSADVEELEEKIAELENKLIDQNVRQLLLLEILPVITLT